MRLVIVAIIGLSLIGSSRSAQGSDWIKLDERSGCSIYLNKIDYAGRFRNFRMRMRGDGCDSAVKGIPVVYRADCEKWSKQPWYSTIWGEPEYIEPGTKADTWQKMICS